MQVQIGIKVGDEGLQMASVGQSLDRANDSGGKLKSYLESRHTSSTS